MKKRNIYITSEEKTSHLYYKNTPEPHIGHLYSVLLADATSRFRRLCGCDKILFSTGTDEHGLKIQQAAERSEQNVSEFCDNVSLKFRSLFDSTGIEYTDFIRTSEERHKRMVMHVFDMLQAKGLIYKGRYSGWYCVSDEAFLTDSQVKEVTEGGLTDRPTEGLTERERPMNDTGLTDRPTDGKTDTGLTDRPITEGLTDRGRPESITERPIIKTNRPESLTERPIIKTNNRPESSTDTGLTAGRTERKMVSIESGQPVEWHSEENYMFKLSKFIPDLRHWLKGERIKPKKFQDQIIRWLDDGIGDLSVSRPNSRISWGIPVPQDPGHTVYVWVDALVNYLTVAGYPDCCPHRKYHDYPDNKLSYPDNKTSNTDNKLSHYPDNKLSHPDNKTSHYPDNKTSHPDNKLNYPDCNPKLWPPDIQVIGKDILKFHGIYWPALLIALGYEPPNQILCHSHWTINGSKMSKSLRNAVNPVNLIEKFTVDGLRYLLLRGGTPHSDNNWSEEHAASILNKELADTLGTLLNRCVAPSLNPKQVLPPLDPNEVSGEAMRVLNATTALPDKVRGHYADLNFYKGIEDVMSLVRDANGFVQDARPWELRSPRSPGEERRLNAILRVALEAVRYAGVTLQPIVPNLALQLLNTLGIPMGDRYWHDLQTNTDLLIQNCAVSTPLGDRKKLFTKIK